MIETTEKKNKELTNDRIEKHKSPEEDDDEAVSRFYSIIAYIIVLLLIGIPVWWMTTRVYRASLPLNEMSDVELLNVSKKDYGIPLSIEYDILISIVNPDPKTIKFDLDARNLDYNLQPFLKKIDSVANFTVKSQWLYMVELGVNPKKVDDHLVLYEDQLPHIITPLEKKLWSHMSPRPCLNLVIYVSQCGSPLHIQRRNEKFVTNAFISPRWGGVLILNPDKASCEGKTFKADLNVIISSFTSQLRMLLGIEANSEEAFERFKLSKTAEMIDSTRRTLKSLAQLLLEISSIVISDDVAEKIMVALEGANEAENFLKENKFVEALKSAKIAFKNSETAFSDPSLLALLYFPDDQKYAVYIPLFLPVMIPVLMSFTSTRRWLSKRRKSKID